MGAYVLVCGKVFDGLSDALTDPAEIFVEDNRIAGTVGRPPGARGDRSLRAESSAAALFAFTPPWRSGLLNVIPICPPLHRCRSTPPLQSTLSGCLQQS